MNVSEEAKKSVVGKLVASILVLIGLLLLAVWKVFLSGVWARAEAGMPKQGLEVLLALAGIAVILLAGALIDSKRKLRNMLAVPLSPEATPESEPESPEKVFRRFGVHWDFDRTPNPLCPACDVLLHLQDVGTFKDGAPWENLRCPKCKTNFALRDDHGNRAQLTPAKNSVYQEQINEGLR